MSEVLTQLDNDPNQIGQLITPLFITIDPLRDTVAKVRDYVEDFHPRLIGLTGTPDQIEKLCKNYRVYYAKANEEDQDYLLDHSIIIYLMDTNGQFLDFFGTNMNEQQMLFKIKQHLNNFIEQQLENKKSKSWW
eukprot:TRINITY_DN1084_c0_g2_i1.p1 TRINITY_DN1084_c0_g2~~TRINITY_DN1084_c0_g2_i1.p1  ORF type:complete len:134 (-),score=8.36 TRINITY_DN1084_c0_g2_i1:8-409(-)